MSRTRPSTPVLREMRWWDIDPVLELEQELFPEDAWSRGMFWSELAHARGPEATRRYVVAERRGEPARRLRRARRRRRHRATSRPSPSPATTGAPASAPGC